MQLATAVVAWQVSALFHIASSKEPPVIPEVLSKEGRDFLLQCFNRCSAPQLAPFLEPMLDCVHVMQNSGLCFLSLRC